MSIPDFNGPTDEPGHVRPPQPEPQTEPPSRRRSRLLAVCGALAVLVALGSVSAYGVAQHGKAVDAQASLRSAKADLSETQSDLTHANSQVEEMSRENATLSHQVDACADLVEVSNHQHRALKAMVVAGTDMTNLDFTSASPHIREADRHVKEINTIIEDSGATDWPAFWTACAPGYSSF